MRALRWTVLPTVVFLLCAGLAPTRPNVKLHLSAVRVVTVDGHVKELPVGKTVLKKGDVVKYVIVATNVGTQPALALTPIARVPAAMAYVAGSARDDGAVAQFTLDGKTWSVKPMVDVKTAHGIVKKPADPALYRSVRWVLEHPLPAHKTMAFSYEVRVK